MRTVSLSCVLNTSACSRNVVVSDQLRTDTLMFRAGFDKPLSSTRVNGQGPAIQDTLASWNTFPSPASRVAESIVAFHLPSGEHGKRSLHGTLPVFTIWNVFKPIPMFSVLVASVEYRIWTFDTGTSALFSSASSSP